MAVRYEYQIDDNGKNPVEIFDLNCKLADGSLRGVKRKFADSIRQAMIHQLIDEILDESIYLGDWQKGEIQITGIKRIVSNRFWTEVEYFVLFPPKQ